jgi:cytochrome c biogenesis protein CcdA
MGIWGSVIDKTHKWILSVAGIVTAAFGIYLYGRQQGSLKEAQKAAEKDQQNARKIEDAADRVRRADGDNLPPVERLSKYKRIRDL